MDAMSGHSATSTEETLDPSDWADVQVLSHRIVDDAVAYLRDVRQRPVWQEMPGDVRDFFTAALPQSPTPLAQIYGDVVDKVMPYPMGNIHPRFWSWYMGSSNFSGALGDFLAAIQGSNLGGGNHAAALMDGQVVDWCKQMTGMPASASGTLVSGGSMANIIGLTVARNTKAGIDVREHGAAAIEKPLRFYGSDQIHSCHRKGMEALGLGNRALRRRIMPIASHIIATEPLPPDLAQSLIPKRRSISDTKRVLCYYRLSPDGTRMVFGGRARFTPADPWLCARVLYGYMTERFPQLRGVNGPIPSRSIRTNGCMRRSRRGVRWCGMPRRIARPSR